MVFGLNVLNMAVVAPWLAWGAFRLARATLPRNPASDATATFLAGALGVVGAAGAFASNTHSAAWAVPPHCWWQAPCWASMPSSGSGRELITAAAVGTIP